jgi:hypothetical protein
MWIAWRILERSDGRADAIVLVAALLYRLVMATSTPTLSDDVYRYVWDGRVQVAGLSPYAHAPDDAALLSVRDDDWSRINHPELPTVYPPLAQMIFAGLAFLGAEAKGFKLFMGLLDFGVVLGLRWLLPRLSLPRNRIVLYAWNPLAVVETAGSGHLEPLGALLVLLAAGFLMVGKRAASGLAFGCAVHAKILPLALLPGFSRRLGWKGMTVLTVSLVALALPYALAGPVSVKGAVAYATDWEHNSFLFAGARRALEAVQPTPHLKAGIDRLKARLGEDALPWSFAYRHVWPDDLGRGLVVLAALAWLFSLARRRWLDPAREAFLALGGVLLLSPTFHPWYALWVLPLAAAYASRGWLLLAALLPLSYLAGSEGVAWSVRCIEYVPAFAFMIWDTFHRSVRMRP